MSAVCWAPCCPFGHHYCAFVLSVTLYFSLFCFQYLPVSTYKNELNALLLSFRRTEWCMGTRTYIHWSCKPSKAAEKSRFFFRRILLLISGSVYIRRTMPVTQ